MVGWLVGERSADVVRGALARMAVYNCSDLWSPWTECAHTWGRRDLQRQGSVGMCHVEDRAAGWLAGRVVRRASESGGWEE